MLHSERVYVCHLEREWMYHREMRVYMCVLFREEVCVRESFASQ